MHLLGQLQPHRLLAFDSIGLLERGHVEPAHRLLTLANNSAAVVDQTIDQKDLGPVQRGFVLIDDRRIGGHEQVTLDPGPGGIGGEGSPGVAGGGGGDPLDPELLGHGNGDRHAAGLERTGG